nr:hypothetical protein [Tanacetum cinerariifolium]
MTSTKNGFPRVLKGVRCLIFGRRTHHQRLYDKRVNKRQMHTQESKVDTSKAVDVDLVITESSGTKSEVQDDSSRLGNDTDADDAAIIPIYDEEIMAETIKKKVDTSKSLDVSLVDTESTRTESKEQDTSSRSKNDAYAEHAYIKPIYDEEPMVEVQTTAKINVFATRQKHTK